MREKGPEDWRKYNTSTRERRSIYKSVTRVRIYLSSWFSNFIAQIKPVSFASTP